MIAYIIFAVIFLLVIAMVGSAIYELAQSAGYKSAICMVLAAVGLFAPSWYLQGFPIDKHPVLGGSLWLVCSVGSLALFIWLGLTFQERHDKR